MTSSSEDGSSASGAGSGTTTTTDDAGFIDPPDVGCLAGCPCDPVAQDCVNPYEKCSGVAEPGSCCIDSSKCGPITGDRQAGDSCTRDQNQDDCAGGLFCLVSTFSGDTGPGVCMEYCDSYDIPDGCGPGRVCTYWADAALPLCYDPCDPVATPCPPLTGCFERQGLMLCQPSGNIAVGEVCGSTTQCQPGMVCESDAVVTDCGGARCCTPYCDLNAPGPGDPCDLGFPGHTCQPWSGAPTGFDHVGVCTS